MEGLAASACAMFLILVVAPDSKRVAGSLWTHFCDRSQNIPPLRHTGISFARELKLALFVCDLEARLKGK